MSAASIFRCDLCKTARGWLIQATEWDDGLRWWSGRVCPQLLLLPGCEREGFFGRESVEERQGVGVSDSFAAQLGRGDQLGVEGSCQVWTGCHVSGDFLKGGVPSILVI